MTEDNNDAGDKGEPDKGDTGPGDGAKFTQADLDRIVKERLARAKSTPPADYDDLKAKAAKFDEVEEANRSDLEKAIARADAAETAAKAAVKRAQQSDIRSKVISEATAAGAVDPDSVFKLIDHDAVTVGNDGQVTGADEAVKALLESKPFLVGKANGSPKPTGDADGGARGSGDDGKRQLSRDDLSTMKPEEIEAARLEGRLKNILSGTT